MEYTWIKNPTPVMMSKNKDESGSTRKLIEAENLPAAIQLNNVTDIERSASEAPSKVLKSAIETMKDNNTEPQAMKAVTPCVNLRVFSATSKKPSSGNKGTRLTNTFILTILSDSKC